MIFAYLAVALIAAVTAIDCHTTQSNYLGCLHQQKAWRAKGIHKCCMSHVQMHVKVCGKHFDKVKMPKCAHLTESFAMCMFKCAQVEKTDYKKCFHGQCKMQLKAAADSKCLHLPKMKGMLVKKAHHHHVEHNEHKEHKEHNKHHDMQEHPHHGHHGKHDKHHKKALVFKKGCYKMGNAKMTKHNKMAMSSSEEKHSHVSKANDVSKCHTLCKKSRYFAYQKSTKECTCMKCDRKFLTSHIKTKEKTCTATEVELYENTNCPLAMLFHEHPVFAALFVLLIVSCVASLCACCCCRPKKRCRQKAVPTKELVRENSASEGVHATTVVV